MRKAAARAVTSVEVESKMESASPAILKMTATALVYLTFHTFAYYDRISLAFTLHM